MPTGGRENACTQCQRREQRLQVSGTSSEVAQPRRLLQRLVELPAAERDPAADQPCATLEERVRARRTGTDEQPVRAGYRLVPLAAPVLLPETLGGEPLHGGPVAEPFRRPPSLAMQGEGAPVIAEVREDGAQVEIGPDALRGVPIEGDRETALEVVDPAGVAAGGLRDADVVERVSTHVVEEPEGVFETRERGTAIALAELQLSEDDLCLGGQLPSAVLEKLGEGFLE